jgi:hypothetical protein
MAIPGCSPTWSMTPWTTIMNTCLVVHSVSSPSNYFKSQSRKANILATMLQRPKGL